MREGQLVHARALLEEMNARFPHAGNRDLALYDLALVAYKQGDFEAARNALDRLQRDLPRASLAEPAARLHCRTLQHVALADAPACFEDLQKRFRPEP